METQMQKRDCGRYTIVELAEHLQDYKKTMRVSPMSDYFKSVIDCLLWNLRRLGPDDSDIGWTTLRGARRMTNLEGTEEDKQIFAEIMMLMEKWL